MKHFLNFKPTVVYRKGSSFMLKTSLVILYSVPLVLAMFWAFRYMSAVETGRFYREAELQLTTRTGEFSDQVAKLRPAREDLEEAEKSYLEYRRASALCQTSWSTLLNRLEKLTPAQVRFRRIGIKPDKLVRISLEGESPELNHVTDFLRRLFAEKVLVNPNLKRHTRNAKDSNEGLVFTLDVDYSGESGDLPK